MALRAGYLTWSGHATARYRSRGMAGSARPCEVLSRQGQG